MNQVMLSPQRLMDVKEAAEKIDTAVLAVQDLAEGEDQALKDAPRLKALRDISRKLASLELELQRLFA